MAQILVVDPDLISRRTMLETLRALGHVAYGREDGRQALDLLAQRPGIEVVISRFSLPRSNGAEFLRAVSMSVPSAAAILVLDPRFDPRRHKLPEGKPVVLLPMPFTSNDLMRAVERAVLGRWPRTEEVTTPDR